MAVSNAQKLAKMKYQQEKRTVIAADVSKAKGEEYRAKAARLGVTVSRLIQLSVEAYGEEGMTFEPLLRQAAENISAADRRLVEAVNALPESTRKIIVKLVEDFASKVKK